MRSLFVSAAFLLFCSSCSSDKENSYYSMDKKYWDVQDYKLAITQLNFDNSDQKELPNMDAPASAAIFKKLIDTTNISIIAADSQLGIAHRASFTSEMFDQYKNLVQAYDVTDRTDKYKYPKEYVEVLKFGLCLQLYYIQANNEKILKQSDNTKDPEVVSLVTSNQDILVGNFNLYLDKINSEDQFTDQALNMYAAGIDYYFSRLVSETPYASYSPMIEKVGNLLNKTKNASVKASLEKLKVLLETRKA